MVKSPACSPIDSLVDLACRNGVDIRPTLLRVITDLYVQKPSHTAEEETQYVELALGLIASADESTRSAVAARLGSYAAAPAAVLAALGITATATSALREQADSDLAELFFAASPEERRLILANLDVAGGPTRQPAPAADGAIARLEAAALQRNADEFGRALEHELGLPRLLAERVACDASGEPLVVAAKALAMPAAVIQRILLILNPAIGHSVEHFYALARLFDELSVPAALCMVDIWRGAPERTRPAHEPVPHEPVYWDDERRRGRFPSNPARPRAIRNRGEQTDRLKGGGRQA